MTTFADPPTQDAFAVPADPRDPAAKRLPRLLAGWEWMRWLTDLRVAVDQKPERKAKVSLTLKSASIATTPIPLGDVPPGIWRLSYHAQITRAASTSSSLEVTFSWTSRESVAQTETGAAITGNALTTHQFGTLVVRVKADTPISYATTYASVGATSMQHSLDIVAEQLALDS